MSRPRVAIDARHLHSGVGACTSNVLTWMNERALPFELTVVTRAVYDEKLAYIHLPKKYVEVPAFTLKAQMKVPGAVSEFDLYHSTTFDAPVARRRNMVVSIYDLIYLHPEFSPSKARWLYAQTVHRLACAAATQIVTLSEFSKRELHELLGVEPERVTVALCGVNKEFKPGNREEQRQTIQRELGIQRPYVLYIGNLKPHKNIPRLIRAFAKLRRREEFTLVLVGDDARGFEEIREEIRRAGLGKSACQIRFVDGRLLPALYGGAEVTVQPSFLEGFGLPVVESMACGTPVICANAASLPEVAGDAALMFDPKNEEELTECLERLLDSNELRADLTRKGFERARMFTWAKFAERHFEVYCKLLGCAADLQDSKLPAMARG